MIGKKPTEHQMSIFEVALESFIDMNHELIVLFKQIDWEEVESDFAEYYCLDNGRPSVPIRTMVGLILLKSIYTPQEALTDRGYRGEKRVGDNRPPDDAQLPFENEKQSVCLYPTLATIV